MMDLLSAHNLPAHNHFDYSHNDFWGRLEDINFLPEKVIAEIFFTLGLQLAQLSRASIALNNLESKNILLTRSLNPVVIDLDDRIENAHQQLLFENLKSLGKIMSQLKLAQPHQINWVKNISQRLELVEMRENLDHLAKQTANGEIASIDQLLYELLEICPQLIYHTAAYSLPPATSQCLDFLP